MGYDLEKMINLRSGRHHRSRTCTWTLAGGFTIFLGLFLLFQPTSVIPSPFHFGQPSQRPVYHDAPPRIVQQRPESLGSTCVGPRGHRLDDSQTPDLPRPTYNLSGVEYPVPTYGSYTELGIDQTWMTFSQRYSPYGYREDEESYTLPKADWSSVNWGRLQDQCLDSNANTFTAQTGAPPRLRFLGDWDLEVNRTEIGSTGRQAIVIRTWSTYQYTPEDLWNLRSLITEASLATNGAFTVFLLVDYKQVNGSYIHQDDDLYREALNSAVPEEFRDLAVLFHLSLQMSWYEKVDEFMPIWQIMQPLQLFAHFYPEFDQYWQLEMDARFTSNAGKILQAFDKFAAKVPYKQSRERASWTYIPSVHGTYAEFSAKLNETMEGNATVWGPVKIAEIPEPLGHIPPMNDTEDNFEFGVGTPADLLIFSPMFEVKRFTRYEDWVFKDWVRGFSSNVPRFSNAPAQARASRSLLHAIHSSQHEKGLRVPSEATLPSWAMWHGMKIVQVPIPNFQWPSRSTRELDMIYNGGPLTKFQDGIANGAAPYMKTVIEFYERPRTWEWQSSLVNPIFNHWIEGDRPPMSKGDDNTDDKIDDDAGNEEVAETVEGSTDASSGAGGGTSRKLRKRGRPAALGDVPPELPPFMAEVDGQVYCPALLMHPRKTNQNPAGIPRPP